MHELKTENGILEFKHRGISVVIGSFNRKNFLKKTIETVRKEFKSCPFPHEIIIVDGGSTDGTLPWLIKQKDIITIVQHNRGEWKGKPIERRSWGYFMNLGFKSAKGKYVCMLSDDCLVIPGAIINGYHLFEERLDARDNVGAIAFYWRNWPEQEKYWVGLTLGDKMFVNHGMFIKSALESVGYIDEENYTFYHADGDLCLKLYDNGFKTIESKKSFIEHYSHANTAVRKSNLNGQKRDWNNYLKKWENIFYNPELENIGGWIEQSYNDPDTTAENYYGFFKKNCILKIMQELRPSKERN